MVCLRNHQGEQQRRSSWTSLMYGQGMGPHGDAHKSHCQPLAQRSPQLAASLSSFLAQAQPSRQVVFSPFPDPRALLVSTAGGRLARSVFYEQQVFTWVRGRASDGLCDLE